MYVYFFHFLKILKSLILRPKKTLFWIIKDYKKDKNARFCKSKFKKVWCAGLPKSGTTLIEAIFEELPYVRQNASFNRIFFTNKLDHPHGISEDIFKFMPSNKYTFIKTHTHYLKKYESVYKNFDLRIIISLRDLRDMLISRYYHILSDKSHYLNKIILDMNKTDGFIYSIKNISSDDDTSTLGYYYNWIKNWLKVANQNDYLILWYEDYNKDPIQYIKKILNYVELNNYDPNDIYKKLTLKNKTKHILTKSLSEYGRDKSTFRKGEVEQWKKFFNEEINKFFYDNLPGNFELIKYND